MTRSLLQEGVIGEGPDAGVGAELLAGVQGTAIASVSATQQEAILGEARPGLHQTGQLTRGGDGGEEHLCGVCSFIRIAPGYEDGCKQTLS